MVAEGLTELDPAAAENLETYHLSTLAGGLDTTGQIQMCQGGVPGMKRATDSVRRSERTFEEETISVVIETPSD